MGATGTGDDDPDKVWEPKNDWHEDSAWGKGGNQEKEWVADDLQQEPAMEAWTEDQVEGADWQQKPKQSVMAPPVPSQQQKRRGSSSQQDVAELMKQPYAVPLICGLRGVGWVFQGFVGGLVLGGFQAVMEGTQLGIARQPGFARAVMASAMGSGASMATWVGVYSSSKCCSQLYRGKVDPLNSFCGAFAASLVTTARTRNPRIIITSGVMHGTLFAAMDFIFKGLPE